MEDSNHIGGQAGARAEVEVEMERLFFASWSCLNESELEELSHLAEQLRDGLRALVDQK